MSIAHTSTHINRDSTSSNVVSSGISTPVNYADSALANPYSNYNYQNSIWDRIGDFFGFRTAQDKYREQMELASKEYDSQLVNTNREEIYNDPASQVSRLREAGLNPDLNGVDVGSASEFNEPQMSPEPPDGSEGLSQMASVIGNVSSIATTVLGLATNINDLKSARLDVENKHYSNISSLLQSASDFVFNTWSSDDLHDAFDSVNAVNALSLGLPRRLRKRFNNILPDVLDSISTRAKTYKYDDDTSMSREAVAKRKSQPYYSDIDSEYEDFLKPLSDLAYKLSMQRIRADFSQASNDQSYQDQLSAEGVPEHKAYIEEKQLENQSEYLNQSQALHNPSAKASQESSLYSEQSSSNSFKSEINSAVRSLVHSWKSSADKGNPLASFGLLLLSGFLNGNISIPKL